MVKKGLNSRSFTLTEMLVVIIIIGVLATLATNYYGTFREKSFDKEAQANLILVAAAEKIYRMENNQDEYIGCVTTSEVNTNLKLSISAETSAWDYQVRLSADAGGSPRKDFCAQAARKPDGTRYWSMTPADNQPVDQSCP